MRIQVIFLSLILILIVSLAFPSLFYSHATTGKIAYEKGDNALAKDELDFALRTWTPGDTKEEKADVYSMLGSIYMAEKDYEKALENFQQVVKLNVKQGHPHFRIGLIYAVQGKNQQAITELKTANQDEPNFFMSQFTLADLYRKTHQATLSIPCYIKATTLNPKSDAAHAGLGDSYRQLGKYESAIKSLELAVKINPNNALAHYTLGLSHSSKKEYTKAIEDYQNALNARVITLDAFRVQVYTFLGEAYENTGQTEKAQEAYKQAKQLLDAIPLESNKSLPNKELLPLSSSTQ